MTGAERAGNCRAGWATKSLDRRKAWDGPGRWDRACVIAALVALAVFARPFFLPSLAEMVLPQPGGTEAGSARSGPLDAAGTGELLVAGYVAQPFYYRSNVQLTRPDGTELDLKKLGWDGDLYRFPIDGGVRALRWGGRFGVMVDFLHNKAIARLGKGAHGRKRKDALIDEVEASGRLKGKPAPKRIKLTDIFERFEFTHGHNVLLFTGMMRFASPVTWLRPYAGVGAGFAIPHTEVRFAGEPKSQRTGEYQYAGPAAQALVGVEFRAGRMSYFLEYKFTYAWILGAITGDESRQNWNMPGDLWRQVNRWWRGEEPKYGSFRTTLGAHQFVAGAGYRWNAAAAP